MSAYFPNDQCTMIPEQHVEVQDSPVYFSATVKEEFTDMVSDCTV